MGIVIRASIQFIHEIRSQVAYDKTALHGQTLHTGQHLAAAGKSRLHTTI